ncbi:MAG TPA: hypothetical protein VGH29_01440 [Candidatus Binataceae bacterium]
MKRGLRFCLIGAAALGLAAVAGVARAQVSVAVTSSVAITVAAGSSISNAGAFSVTNSSGATITINSINLSATSPGIFTSMTLTGQSPQTASIAAPSSPAPPGSSNSFDFTGSGGVTLLNGQVATFSLSAVASSAPAPTPTSTDSGQRKAVYAGIQWPLASGQSKTPGLLLTALALGMLLMTGNLRRRHLVVLAMGLILAATEVGCGNSTSGVTGTSTQAVQTLTVSSGGAATGLPASLGSITVQ